MKQRFFRGFTLVEILIVISIIAILAGTIFAYAGRGSAASRDAKRQADLIAIQTAIEQFKSKVGRYPEQCAQADTSAADGWSGESGTDFACASGSQYIVGLVPTYITVLPRDPRLTCTDGQCGYVYRTNAEGTAYKLMAMNSVENETVTYTHRLKSCDYTGASNNDIRVTGICGRRLDSGNNIVNVYGNTGDVCNAGNSRFQKTYAVWGGFAPLAATVSNATLCLTGGKCVNEESSDPMTSFVGGPSASEMLTLRVRAVNQTVDVICR